MGECKTPLQYIVLLYEIPVAEFSPAATWAAARRPYNASAFALALAFFLLPHRIHRNLRAFKLRLLKCPDHIFLIRFIHIKDGV